jgi:hypothetical protein
MKNGGYKFGKKTKTRNTDWIEVLDPKGRVVGILYIGHFTGGPCVQLRLEVRRKGAEDFSTHTIVLENMKRVVFGPLSAYDAHHCGPIL